MWSATTRSWYRHRNAMPPGRHHPRRRRRRRAGPHRRFCGRAWNLWPRRPSRPLRCATRQACAVWVWCPRAMPTRRSVSPTTSPRRPNPTPMTWRSMNPSPNQGYPPMPRRCRRPCQYPAKPPKHRSGLHAQQPSSDSSDSPLSSNSKTQCRRYRVTSAGYTGRICQRVAELDRRIRNANRVPSAVRSRRTSGHFAEAADRGRPIRI